MPSTPKQMRAAGRELQRRRNGEVKQEQIVGRGTRPFGAASTETLRAYASHPKPNAQRAAANNELFLRATGQDTAKNRAFATATDKDVKFFANASDADIRKRNGQT